MIVKMKIIFNLSADLGFLSYVHLWAAHSAQNGKQVAQTGKQVSTNDGESKCWKMTRAAGAAGVHNRQQATGRAKKTTTSDNQGLDNGRPRTTTTKNIPK